MSTNYIWVLQATLNGDEVAIEVLHEADTSIEGKVSQAVDVLAEKQIERHAELEAVNQERLHDMEKELDEEQNVSEKKINEQIDEQKKKVYLFSV